MCLSWIGRDFFSLFFPLAVKLVGPQTGCQFFKNFYFSFDNPPLNLSLLNLVHFLFPKMLLFIGNIDLFYF